MSIVTDTTPNTMEVRALMTAKDADDVWTVRVTVREAMIRWLVTEHSYALPRVNTADAVLPTGWRRFPDGSPDGSSAGSPDGAARRAHEPPRTGRG